MKKFSADMKVVRFGAEDVIATSGAADMVFHSTMGDGNKGNGTVTFNGLSYTLENYGIAENLLNAIGAKYQLDEVELTEIDSGSENEPLEAILLYEVGRGLKPGWVGSYTYDATSNKFTRQ